MRSAVILIAALAGCATPASPGVAAGEATPPERGAGDCRADAARALIGQAVTVALGKRAIERSGARVLRWVPAGAAVTMDYRTDRVNVAYDARSIVTRVDCG